MPWKRTYEGPTTVAQANRDLWMVGGGVNSGSTVPSRIGSAGMAGITCGYVAALLNDVDRQRRSSTRPVEVRVEAAEVESVD